jgi:putative transposase
VTHPRERDRQGPATLDSGLQAQVKLALPGRDPLPRRSPERLQLFLVMRGPMCSISREREDAALAARIKTAHEESKGRYGAPRVHAQLRTQGHRHSRKRVARLMRAQGLQGRAAERWKKTTVPDPAAAARADRIRRDFTADASKLSTRWCGDITCIATWEGWLYLATVTGIASRRVVGYALADHLRTELIADALSNAVAARDPQPGVVFHSDRGCQAGFKGSSQQCR